MLARAGISPLENRAKKLYNNVHALAFMHHWQTKIDEERWQRLGKMLGVIWHREDVEDQGPQHVRKRAPDEVFIPLALAIEPSLQDQLKKMFGRSLGIMPPGWAKRGEMLDLFDINRDDFMQFVQTFVRPKVLGR